MKQEEQKTWQSPGGRGSVAQRSRPPRLLVASAHIYRGPHWSCPAGMYRIRMRHPVDQSQSRRLPASMPTLNPRRAEGKFPKQFDVLPSDWRLLPIDDGCHSTNGAENTNKRSV